jgi:hypothetical protein
MCFVAVFDFSFGKFAGENDDWQAAKTKIHKNLAPGIPACAGRRAPKTISVRQLRKVGSNKPRIQRLKLET